MGNGPIFKPRRVQRRTPPPAYGASRGGDARNGRVYVYHDEDIELAVNVAWATGRPMLIRGPSGCGKSSLALNVALTLQWRYYEYVVTSQSRADDLLWRLDSIQRLNDAQAGRDGVKTDAAYVEPGVLWWAFDRHSARDRGSEGALPEKFHAKDPWTGHQDKPAVVLIDEIDKAEVDVPNNLLVPLGSLQFSVTHRKDPVVAKEPPLIFITTNGERELPVTFLRRCVALTLSALNTEDKLREIALSVIAKEEHDEGLFNEIAAYVLSQPSEDAYGPKPPDPSTAEYLDIVRACLELNIRPGTEQFDRLAQIILYKGQEDEDEAWLDETEDTG